MDGEDQPAASQISEMDTPLDHAQEEAMPLVEWALTPMGHCKPKEEYARVIASTNHLEILCFVTGRPLARLLKLTKNCSVWSRMLNVNPQGPDGAEQGQFLVIRRGGKRRKRYDLGSEWSGEHLRNITQPWFQDELGVVRPEFQASRVDGKGL